MTGTMAAFHIVIESADDGTFSAYVPDLPGCVCSGPTPEYVAENIRHTIAFHIHGMRENGDLIPEPSP